MFICIYINTHIYNYMLLDAMATRWCAAASTLKYLATVRLSIVRNVRETRLFSSKGPSWAWTVFFRLLLVYCLCKIIFDGNGTLAFTDLTLTPPMTTSSSGAQILSKDRCVDAEAVIVCSSSEKQLSDAAATAAQI